MMINATRALGSAISLAAVMGMSLPSIANAQVKAAVTRDVDNGDLAPVRLVLSMSLAASEGFKETDSVTVPAGKRLIVDNASIWAFTNDSADVITGIWLQVKNQVAYTLLDPSSVELRKICGGACGLAAYNRTIKMTFEAGETVHGVVFAEGTSAGKIVNIYLQGHYVTP